MATNVVMKKLNDNLSEIFDIEPIKIEQTNTEIVEVQTNIIHEDELESDFGIARNNIKNLLSKGDSAIDNLIKVAEESEHPRAYEVVATLMKTMADLNKDLLDLRKKKQDISGIKPVETNQTNIDKAVFVGSTTDLIKLLKDKKEE